MQLPSVARSLIFCFSLASLSAHAADILPISSRIRGLGMGNAQYSLVDDKDSLFYNPAGLARAHGMTWTVLGIGAGVGSDVVSNIEELENIESGGEFADLISDFYGDKIFANASGLMALTFPYLSMAVYNQTYASITVNNPVYPELPVRFINDYGYAVGAAFPITSIFHVGMVAKRIKRSGVDKTYRASSLTTLDPDVLESEFTQWGVGYALDLGTNIVIDGSMTDVIFSGVWQNVGDTKFRSVNDSDIPTDKANMGVGVGVIVDLPLMTIAPALDVTHLNRSDIQLMRKFNFGVEVGLPLLDLRAGFHQGYYSLGAGIGFGPMQFDAATYGVELGDYPGQMEDRRYMVEMTIELGIGSFPFGGSSSSSSGRSRSYWGGKRLKQRR